MKKETLNRGLIVGDRAKVMQFLGVDPASLPLTPVFATNGEQALDKIRSTDAPFALVVSDQRLEHMTGTQLLEQVMTLSPDAIRLLITRYSDIAAIKDSVNKGIVHRYLLKSDREKGMLMELRLAVNQYNIQQAAAADLEKAKSVSRQLYQLDQELIDSKKSLDQAHGEIDREIASLREKIQALAVGAVPTPDRFTELAVSALGATEEIRLETLRQLYEDTVVAAFGQFEEIAKRSGINMPKPGEPESHEDR